jgi:hypothetical protein
MKLVRSGTSEVAGCIASGGARASRHWPALVYGSSPNVLILLIAVAVSLSISVRAAAWLAVPVFLVWNVYVLWCTKSSRRNWVIAACADQVYIRLLMTRGGTLHGVKEPDVIVFEASEIASMSIRTVEVFLYGPKPKFVEWLVIEPAQAVAEIVSNRIHPSPRPLDPGKQVYVANEEGRLTIGWKWCHPALRIFLQQVVRGCPSVVIANEERSELDLNGIWRGTSLNLDAQKRQLLLQAKRLGFGSDCRWLLCRYKYISFRKAATYLAEIEREEAGTGHSAIER